MGHFLGLMEVYQIISTLMEILHSWIVLKCSMKMEFGMQDHVMAITDMYAKLPNVSEMNSLLSQWGITVNVCLFVFILYVPSTVFQLNRDGSSWVEPVLS